MATNYQRGRAIEYNIKSTLEGAGFTCTRSASSQGLWDVTCVRADEVRYVQGKLTSTGDFSEDENCALFRQLAVPACVKKELWLYEAGQGIVEVRDLKAPKPDARTEEGKAQREANRAKAAHIRALQAQQRALKKARPDAPSRP